MPITHGCWIAPAMRASSSSMWTKSGSEAYSVALREFQRSHALSHNPALYFNMGACEEKENHDQAAALLLRQCLIEKPTADDRDKVEARIKVLEERDNDMKRPEPPVEKP